jgi:hypothetical protein
MRSNMTAKRTEKLILPFGYNAGLPLCTPFAWGARAVCTWPKSFVQLERGTFDIPQDRRGSVGEGFTPHRQAMMDKLNAARALDRLAKAVYAAWDDREAHNIKSFEEAPLVTIDEGAYRLQAKMQGGYIYIAAYPIPTHTEWASAYGNVARDLVQVKHPEAWADNVENDAGITGIFCDGLAESNESVTGIVRAGPARLIAASTNHWEAWIEAAHIVWAQA